MTEADYIKVLEHLDAASRVLQQTQGAPSDGTILVSQLIGLCAKEARRQLAEARRAQRQGEPVTPPIASQATSPQAP